MTYPGGKNAAGTYQKIINLMPPHETYIEPFLGSGAILRIKRPALHNIGLDLDLAPIRKVVHALISTEGHAFRSAITLNQDGPHEEIEFTIPTDQGNFRLINTDALAFLRDHTFSTQTLIYLDPPYLRPHGSHRRIYRYELSGSQHVELLALANDLPCMVIISGYLSILYARELESWNQVSFQVQTRGHTTAIETLWYNYDPPTELHDTRFLGATFRERERINRMKRRWANRLAKMPPLQQQALREALQLIPDDRAPRNSL